MTDKCAKCDTVAELTTDHIIPKWLEQRINLFDVHMIIVGRLQKICEPCNTKKGGKLDYGDALVKDFTKEFIKQLESKIS